jgi:hypothetical protein
VGFVSRELLFLYLSDHVNIGKGRSDIMSPIEFTISVQFCNKSLGSVQVMLGHCKEGGGGPIVNSTKNTF